MSNFKPNLIESKVVLTNGGPALETNVNSLFPIIREIKSEVPDEATFTDKNDSSRDLEINFTEDNKLNNDEITPETVLSVTDKELKEEIFVKEECSDSSREESVDIADIELRTPSDDEKPLNEIKERPVQIILEEIDTGAPRRKRTLNEIPEQAKRIKLEEISTDVSFAKNLTAASNVGNFKSEQIIKSAVNSYELNKMSPKVNILQKDNVQAINIIVQDHKTLTSKVCYSNVEDETFKRCLPNSIEEVAPNTSLVRNDKRNKLNSCNKKRSDKGFTCRAYQNQCPTGKTFNMSSRKHIKEKLYVCDVCEYKCLQKSHLAEHIKHKHIKAKNFSCHVCQYKCVNKATLNKHLHTHTGEKPYTCSLCDCRFAKKSNLRSHIMYKHTKEKNFSCHMCQHKCVTKRDLNLHLRKHTGEKPYTCDLCDNRFSQKSQLGRHLMYKHVKEKNFSCHMCQYKCVIKEDLNRHLRKHTGEKPFRCDLCDNNFSRKNELNMHIKYKHTNEKSYSCPMCQYKCVTKYQLNSHNRIHTGEKPYKCEICDFRCSHPSNLKSHTTKTHKEHKILFISESTGV